MNRASAPQTPEKQRATPPGPQKPRNASVALFDPSDDLFPESTSDTATTEAPGPSKEAVARSQRLRDAVVANGRFGPKWSATKWALEMDQLSRALSGDESRLDVALDWYVAHIGTPYTPEAFSASAFREKFQKIEAAIARSKKGIETPLKQTYKDVKDPDADGVVKRVLNTPWVKVTREDLEVVVRRSFANSKAAFARFETAKLSKENEWYRKIVFYRLGAPELVVENWMIAMYKKYAKWEDWSGNTKNLVWRADHPEFVKLIDQTVREQHGGYSQPQIRDEILAGLQG